MFNKFFDQIDLRHEIEDFANIHQEIEKGVSFKGTNLWVLVFAIVIASVGLNTNSTAVIIGAMLISPLMGPINGMGYSIATYNFELFSKSAKNFTFAVIASLLASTLYFVVSPVSTAHSELLARTTPTIYDVLIALFGGLAGIVAISSKLKGNVIPGVAIATALMPPLCTAGYGLATAQYNFFFGAFYLFTINTVFIAISSVLVSQFFKFPITTLVDSSQKKTVNRWITIIIMITLLPSIYFGYKLVKNEQFYENSTRYINNITYYEGSYLLKYEIEPAQKKIRLIYGGQTISEENKLNIKKRASDFNVENPNIIIEQGFSNDEKSINENDILRNKLNATLFQLNETKRLLDSIQMSSNFGKTILNELQTIYPRINFLSYSNSNIYSTGNSDGDTSKIALILLSFPAKSISSQDKDNINKWLEIRLNNKNIKTIYIEEN